MGLLQTVAQSWHRLPILQVPEVRALVHFHLPRTGGTWLRQSLVRHFRSACAGADIWFVNGREELGCAAGPDAALAALPAARRAELRLVSGHMRPETLDLFEDGFKITVLRDPVERALSDYWYCWHKPENPAHAAARALDPVTFCLQGHSQARNGQARYLSGAAYGAEMGEAEMLARARETLSRFDLVGLDCALGGLLDGLCAAGFGRVASQGDRNEAARLYEVSHADAAKLWAANALDVALYEEVLERADRE